MNFLIEFLTCIGWTAVCLGIWYITLRVAGR